MNKHLVGDDFYRRGFAVNELSDLNVCDAELFRSLRSVVNCDDKDRSAANLELARGRSNNYKRIFSLRNKRGLTVAGYCLLIRLCSKLNGFGRYTAGTKRRCGNRHKFTHGYPPVPRLIIGHQREKCNLRLFQPLRR